MVCQSVWCISFIPGSFLFLLLRGLLFQIPTVYLMTFLDALEAGYGKYKNPYHNQIHAADVTQTVHCFLLRTGMVVRLYSLATPARVVHS